ncbi:MAG TPA: phosphoribosylaminoimidazolesuccinocarboxamide synthase [Bryobacteraceae bacterium]|nr:phosphoribosylaminoimidazolesuccinocarboxamide synthase [Bryobacteraceae bacterium]
MTPLTATDLPGLRMISRGKVRDIFEVGDALLFVATDRISAFDHVLTPGIPRKGEVLTQLSLFWFDQLRDLVPHHVLTADVAEYPAELHAFHDQLAGRSMLVRRLEMLPVECVARGYLAGSGWNEYRERGSVCGIPLPSGLRHSDRLPEPLFTPATKAESGHDENISFEQAAAIVGQETAERLRMLTLELYRCAAEYAQSRGLLLADTKFEFGTSSGQIVLADEVLTPDSSRYWPRDGYAPGAAQPSYDKQFVRDWLEKIGWNKTPPAPVLPDDVVLWTSEKYMEAFRLLTGRRL